MRRLAPLAALVVLLLAPAGGARAAEPAPAGGTVTGVAFQDANGDGAQQPGELGLAGWVVWADMDGNAVRDASEPSAPAAADGRYTLGPIAAGTYTLRVQQPDGSACPQTATCARPVTIADGAQATVDFPVLTPSEPPKQLIDPDPVRIGPFRLTVRHSCARRPFYARLSGRGAYRVDFRVDGRLVRSVRLRPDAERSSVRIAPSGLRRGAHTLTAALYFSSGSSSPSKTLTAKFSTCALRRVHLAG
jgi:hypothetical protein